ncbi:MAG: hypothetical protein AAGF81_10575 [Pseudomonadota bacterium]
MNLIVIAAASLGATMATAAAQTAEEQYNYLHSKCGPALQMSKSECDCIVAMAKSDLSGKELDMAVLMVKQDQAGIAKLHGEMTGQQMSNTVAFVTGAPTKCRNK